MSININVNGMECYAERAAAEKRKINRLLMVREQSNELAHRLRNKVRLAQGQELKKLQEQSERELGEWKRRNHCQIQAKIDECIGAFGSAHIAAVDASCEENELLRAEREEKDLIAASRGRKAMLQIQREREKLAEERLMKKKRHSQKTVGIQADFLTQHGFSETVGKKRNSKQHNGGTVDDEDEEEKAAMFMSKPNVHKHSIKIDANYNAQNYTSNSVDSSNNCDSDEIEDLQEENDETRNESEVEFDQIRNVLNHRMQVPAEQDETEAISMSESTSSIEIIPPPPPKKITIAKKQTPKKKSILKKSPNKKASKTSPVKKSKPPPPVAEHRVRYVDYTKSNYETTYVADKDLITRSEKPRVNAKQEAQVQTDDHMISRKINDDILKQLTELRSHEAIEKEKIRRDYERLRLELDELSKLEQEAKSRTNAHRNLTRDQLLRREEAKQRKLNEAVENTMRGNIVMNNRPPVDHSEKLAAKQNTNANNVAMLNLASAAPQVDSATGKKKSNEELNKIVKVERLKDLLEKINHQKRLLLNEIEKSDDVPGPDLEKVIECLNKLEEEKALLDADDKAKNTDKRQQVDQLTEREKKVREREQRLEDKLRKLYKQKKTATAQLSSSSSLPSTVSLPRSESESSSSSTEQQKKIAQPPVEIIIKVQQPKPPRKKKTKPSFRCVDTLNREPGKVYPKTPIRKKKTAAQPVEEIAAEKPEIEKRTQPQQTQTEAPKAILKNSQTKQISIPPVSNAPPKQPAAANNQIDHEDFSLSTVYRELPPEIHIDQCQITKPKKKKTPRALNPTLMHYITRLLGMSKNIGSQLNVDVSSVSTPGSSTINTSGNVSSVNDINFDQDRMNRLQKFIDDNYSFLSEVNESLERAQEQQQTHENDFEKVQGVWGDVLHKKKPGTRDDPQSKASSSQLKLAKTKPTLSKSIAQNKNTQLPHTEPKKKSSTHVTTQQPAAARQQSSRQRPLTVPIQNRPTPMPPQISTEEMEKVTKYLESKMMTNYKEYTDNCQKRINELTKMMEQVRQEKLKLIENSLSSNEANVYTEYKDIAHHNNAGSSDQKDSPSNRDDPPSEEINNILKTQSTRPFGLSKDSGIASSRPVTSSDFRDSPDARVTSEENTNVFKPIPNDMAALPHVKITSSDGNTHTVKNVSQLIRQQDEKKKLLLQKPPLSIKSFSPQVDKQHEGHELSTIAEIETPSASKANIADESLGLAALGLNSFPNFDEYADKLNAVHPKDNSSFLGMDSLKNALPDLHIKTFVGPQAYDIQELSKEIGDEAEVESVASSGSSLMDVQEELKRRNIFNKSFELYIEADGDVNFVNAAAPTKENEKKTTPTTVAASPKKKSPPNRIVINTPDNGPRIEIVTTPTKAKKQQRAVPEAPSSPKSNDTLSGIQEIENDLHGVGLNWAANVLKRTEEAQKQRKESSSSSDGKRNEINIDIDLGTSTSSSDGRPLNLKEFLRRELVSRTNDLSDDSSLSSRFLKSLLNASSGGGLTSSNSGHSKGGDSTSNPKLRTSTPVRMSSDYITATKTAASSQLFVGAESVSTVKDSSNPLSEKSDKENNEA